MGADQTAASVRPANRSAQRWFALLIGLLLLPACSEQVASSPTGATLPSINTPTPRKTATATLTQTATASPSPTPTPGDQLALDVQASVGYHLPLTIQHISEHEAVFYFTLEYPTPGKLFLWQDGTDPRVGTQVDFSADRAQHQIRIPDLLPGTVYWAAVGLEDGQDAYLPPQLNGQQWGPLQVKTYSGDFPLRVGVIGDSGFGGRTTYDLAASLVAMKPDLVLHTGDIVYHAHEEQDPRQAFVVKYYLPLAAVLHAAPLYPTIGNHELDASAQWQGRPFYDAAFPAFGGDNLNLPLAERWYAFGYGPVQFIVLDSMAIYDGIAYSSQNRWLDERLADPSFQFSILNLHVPPYTAGAHVDDGLVARRDWAPRFEAARVPLVLSGHDHNYQRLLVGGVTYVISGGGSRVLYSKAHDLPESQVFARESHFVWLEIYPDRIDLRAIGLDGKLIDRTSIAIEKP